MENGEQNREHLGKSASRKIRWLRGGLDEPTLSANRATAHITNSSPPQALRNGERQLFLLVLT